MYPTSSVYFGCRTTRCSDNNAWQALLYDLVSVSLALTVVVAALLAYEVGKHRANARLTRLSVRSEDNREIYLWDGSEP
jgi:hypothetical protein